MILQTGSVLLRSFVLFSEDQPYLRTLKIKIGNARLSIVVAPPEGYDEFETHQNDGVQQPSDDEGSVEL